MKLAILQLEQDIRKYENDRDKKIAFYESDTFKSQMNEDADLEFVAEHTNNIYAELIGHLTEALLLIKQHVKEREGVER